MIQQETELRGKRDAKWNEIRALIKDGFTPEVREKYDTGMTELSVMDSDLARYRQAADSEAEERKRQEKVEADKRAVRPSIPQPGERNENEERSEDKAVVEKRKREHRSAFTHYLRTRDESELRAMNSTAGPNGGFVIPTLTESDLETALQAFGGIAPYLRSRPTSTGEQINWPLLNDVANAGRELGENVDSTETDLTFGTKAMTVGLFTTDMVLIPRTLIRDSVVDLASEVMSALGERRARLLSEKIIGGSTGTSFDSLLTAATVGATSEAQAAISLPDVANLFGAVDPGYAGFGDFACNRATQIYLTIQRNAYGTPIFPLDQNGLCTNLFGRPVRVDMNLPNIAAGNKALLFGALTKYILRPVGTMEVQRLDERFATANQVAYLGFWAAGGAYINAGTNPIQSLQQHA
jgi:HK97 family phage major capsid protein